MGCLRCSNFFKLQITNCKLPITPLMTRMFRFLPNRTRQFDFPNWAALVELAFHSYECRSLAAGDPNVNVFGLLPENRRNYSGDSAKLHFYFKTQSSTPLASDRKCLLSLRLDGEFHQPRLR